MEKRIIKGKQPVFWGRKSRIIVCISVLTISLVNIPIDIQPVKALSGIFTEDFTTTDYMDSSNTNATWWGSGTLRSAHLSPTLIGSYDTPTSINSVFVAGDYAYLACYTSGLIIINITDLTNPINVSSYVTTSWAYDVYVAGNLAYVATKNGLTVINISDPTNPSLVGSYTSPGDGLGIFVAGDIAYIADGGWGLRVVDVSNPANPTSIGDYDTSDETESVVVAGDYAYLASGNDGLLVMDISDPTTPTLAGSYITPIATLDVAVAGDYLYAAVVGDPGRLQVIRISDPTSPAPVGSINATAFDYQHLCVEGNYAYLSDYNGDRLDIIDISDPTTPTLVGNYITSHWGKDVFVEGNHAFFCNSLINAGGRMNVLEISDPVTPSSAGTLDIGTGMDIFVSGDYAYMASSGWGLEVINISDPTNPSLAGHLDRVASALVEGVFVEGDYAYLADSDGLKVVDISNPASPSYVGSFASTDIAYDVFVEGNYAYLSLRARLEVIDISDPTTPTSAGYYAFAEYGHDVVIDGNYAYVAVGNMGLLVVNITVPTNPTFAGVYNTPGGGVGATGVFVAGDMAYVADADQGGLQIINISNPAAPTFAGSYNTPNWANDVVVAGDFAYVADGTTGMLRFNITDPTSPTLYGSFPVSDYAWGVFVEGDYAFIANNNDGFEVVEVNMHKCRQSQPLSDAQSTVVYTAANYTTVIKATVSSTATVPSQTSITYYLSADNGLHWEPVTLGVTHFFAYTGTQLLWRVTLASSNSFKEPTISSLTINYNFMFNALPLLSPVDELVTNNNLPFFRWKSITGAVNYQIQLDNVPSFDSPSLIDELSSVPNFMPSPALSDGFWYWRVAAIDTEGDVGAFSEIWNLTLDTSPPTIDQPENITYEQGASGYNIIWSPSDLTPSYYNVTRNGTLADEDFWDGTNIVHNVDSLSRGEYTYICNVYDQFGLRTSDTVNVTVIDTTSPFIDSPDNITYEEFASGNVITWTPNDYNPYYYNVTRNDDLVDNKTWTGGEITIDVDDLPLGTHTYICYVYDLDGNSVSDMVYVSVIDVGPPFIEQPSDFSIEYEELGYSILWTCSDDHPSNYTVYHNDAIYKQGFWTTTVIIWLENLEIGDNNFTCVISDTSGLTNSDEVIVTVNPPTPDTTPPYFLSPPQDSTIEEGSIGYSITWTGSDARSPWWVLVWRNDTLIYNHSWVGNDIEISLDNLTIGSYEFNCTLFDQVGNSAFDIVLVIVTEVVPDFKAPDISPPDSITYEEDTIGNYLTWTCFDNHPYAYKITINDSDSIFGPWHGENITFCVDGLTVGLWIVNLTIWDLSWNYTSNVVNVIVFPALPDLIPPSVGIPATQTIAEGMAGTIIWDVNDEHPDKYSILRNNTLILEHEYWISGIIQYYFTSLAIGSWEFTLIVWDLAGNNASSSTIIIVLAGNVWDKDPPLISHFPDVDIVYGSTNNFLQFDIFDQHPLKYSFFVNNFKILETPWTSPNKVVYFSLDGLAEGLYVIMIKTWDLYTNNASRTVNVNVVGDIIPPGISSPPDTVLTEGRDGNVTWKVYDVAPAQFEIISMTDDDIVEEGTWSGESIILDISDLAEGTYHFRCIVYDASGNYAMDDVVITVTKPKSAPGFEILFIIPLIMIIITMNRMRKRRRSQK